MAAYKILTNKDLLTSVVDYHTDNCILFVRNNRACSLAKRFGDVSLFNRYESCRLAGETGNANMIEHILNAVDSLHAYYKELDNSVPVRNLCYLQAYKYVENVVVGAAKSGHLKILQWLIASHFRALNEVAMKIAAKNGHLHVVKWLHSSRVGEYEIPIIDYAAKNGHLEIVKWLHENGVTDHTKKAMDGAAGNGHLHVVKWLHENSTLERPATKKAMDSAVANGHLRVAQWLHQNRDEGCTTMGIDSAMANGHFHVVKWMCENNISLASSFGADAAAGNGHLDILDWLENSYGKKYGRVVNITENAMNWAASSGHISVLNWLYDHDKVGYTDEAINKAARNGHITVLQWFKEKGFPLSSPTLKPIDSAAEQGRLDIIEWLHSNGGSGCTWRAIDNAALNNHFDVIKWLHKHYRPGCDQAFDYAARCGNIAMMEWLHERYPQKCVSENIDMSCIPTSYIVQIIKWLRRHMPHGRINLDEYIELFIEIGGLETVKWIYYNIGCDLRAAIDAAFEMRFIDAYIWLSSKI